LTTTAKPSKTSAGAKDRPERRCFGASFVAAEPEDIAQDYVPAIPFSQLTAFPRAFFDASGIAC
jgi:hypothetical protein